jgi:hypothetical protein
MGASIPFVRSALGVIENSRCALLERSAPATAATVSAFRASATAPHTASSYDAQPTRPQGAGKRVHVTRFAIDTFAHVPS